VSDTWRTTGNHRSAGNDHAESVIEVRNLTKRFGEKLVLNNVSLSLEKSKTTVVIGPSGCGKTVLIKHFIVLVRPSAARCTSGSSGSITFGERELNEIRTHLATCSRKGRSCDGMTVTRHHVPDPPALTR